MTTSNRIYFKNLYVKKETTLGYTRLLFSLLESSVDLTHLQQNVVFIYLLI